MFAYVCMSVSLMTELTAQQQQLLEDAQSESVPEGVYPAAGRASPCASLPSLAAGLAAAEPQPPSAFPTGSTRGGPADPRQQDLLCTRMLLSTQLIQLSLMVFWRAADLLARAGAGDGGPRALLLPAPAGLRGDRQLVALPCLDTVHQRSPPGKLHSLSSMQWSSAGQQQPVADAQPLRGANLQLRSTRPSQPSYQLRLLHIFSLFTDINPRHITRKGSALPARLVNCFTVAHDSDIDNLMWHNCALKLRWSSQLPRECPVSGLVAQPGALHSGCSSLAPHSHCKTPMQLGGCSCPGSGLPAKPQVCPVVRGGLSRISRSS